MIQKAFREDVIRPPLKEDCPAGRRTHGGLRSRKAGFDSRVGDREIIESSGCAGFAHDPAKVEDQVQFLARASAGLDPCECVGRTAVF